MKIDLNKELARYEAIKKETIARLAGAPEGTLRISYSNKKIQYYHRIKDDKKNCGTYIPKAEIELAQKLAQKSYDEKLQKLAVRRIQQLSVLAEEYKESEIDDILLSESQDRQKLIRPIQKTKDQLIREWQEEKYVGKAFAENDPLIITDKGERVRSKSEKILADYFYHNGIPYKYERPLILKGYGTVYPDFTLLNKNTLQEKYWEHEGMMDDPVYASAAIKKIKTYEGNGIFVGDSLILSYETKGSILNNREIERNVKRYLL